MHNVHTHTHNYTDIWTQSAGVIDTLQEVFFLDGNTRTKQFLEAYANQSPQRLKNDVASHCLISKTSVWKGHVR